MSSSDINAIKAYNAQIDACVTSQTAFRRTMMGASKSAQDLVAKANGNTVALGNLTRASKAAEFGMKALSTAANMVVFIAISKAISTVVQKFDDWRHRAENAKEAAEELTSTLKSANDSLESQKELIDRVEESYEKLSKGVDSLGNNVSLSKEDFADYQDICNKIAEYYPQMVSAWTKEGDAVVDLKDKVNDLKTAYEEEHIAALNSFVVNADDIVDSYNLNANNSAKFKFDKTSGYKQQIAALKAYLNAMTSEDYYGAETLLMNGGEGFSGIDLKNALINSGTTDSGGALKYELDQLPSHINGVIKNLQTKLSQEDDSMRQMLVKMFELDSNDYENISDKAYQLGTSFINSLDSSFFDDKNIGDYREFVDNLLEQLTGENADKISLTLDSLVSLDKEKGSLSVSEYKDYVNKIIADLQTYLDLDENVVKLMVETQLSEDEITFQDVDTMVNNVKEKLQDDFDNKVGELTLEELQIAAEQIEVSDDHLLSWDELKDRIERIKSTTDNIKQISFTDAISEVQSLSEGLDQLDKIYADVYDKGDFDWSSILNNDDFSKTFSGFTEEYNNFIQTISNSPSDIDACQESFNRLASAYLNASDVLGEQLTEETKKATIEILKQQGFVNAETLVTQVLTQRKEELALEEQFEAAAKQSETVESQNLTNATIDEINQLVSEGLITSETAEQMNLLAFKKQWVNRNTINTSADIKNLAALAGVSSKLAQLLNSLALAKQQVEGGIPAKAMEATIASLEKQIDEYVNGNFGNFENPVYGGGASTKSAKEKSSSSSKKKEDTTETLDWVETKLEAVSKQTSKLEDAFDKTFTPSSTTDKFREYLGQIQEEIAANNTAISTYQDYLNNIGLSGDWIYKIQNGLYSIEEITDDTLKEQISNYQTYYDKIVSCQETINSLEGKRLELEDSYAQKLIGYQEKETSAIEKQIEKQEKLIKLKETFGTSFAKKNLKSEQKLYKDELGLLEKQNGELLALQSTVAEGTDAWGTYQDQIDSNKDSMAGLIQSMADLAKSIANLPLDKLDAFLEKNNKKNELYEAKLGNEATASSKNKLINKQIKIAKSNNKETQDTAKTTAENFKTSTTAVGTARKSDNVSKTDSLYKKVKSYISKKKLVPASLITQLGEKGYGNLVAACENYNAALTANETAQETAKLTAEETKSQVAGFVKQKFDNVQTQYENKQGLISSKANIVSSKMDLAAAKGYLDSENWYKQLIEYEQRNQQSLTEELSDLQTRLETAVSDGKIQIYSDEW